MKRILGLIPLLVLITSILSAGEIIHNVTFSQRNLSFSQDKGFDLIKYDYHPNFDDMVGYPSLPELPLYIVIPPSATVSKVEVTWADERLLPGRYRIMPAQHSGHFGSYEEPGFVPPDNKIYQSSEVWPGKLVEYRYTGTKGGYRIGVFRVYPVRYIPKEQKLVFCNSMRLRITYQEGTVAPLRQTARQIAFHASDLATMVDNGNRISIFAPPQRFAGNSGSMYLQAGNYEHVILTPTVYKDTFQILADWRTKMGIPSRVFCIESTSVYPGKDVAEKMRNFLQDADTTWGTIFAFIARQDRHSPLNNREYRRCWVHYSIYRESLPCDLYYSDLFRGNPPNTSTPYDWDGNGNGVFGEVNDTIDYFSDIYVGMVTLDDAGQASHFLRKLLRQETNPDTNFFAKAIMLNACTFSDSFLNKAVNAMTIPPWKYDKMYQTGAGNEYPSASKFRDSVNAGYGYSAIIAHGSVEYIMIPDNYTKGHVGQQTNTNKLNTLIAVCCHPGAFHSADECLAESMAVANGGFINVMMNASYGWVRVAEHYDELFFYKFMPMKSGTPCSAYVYVGQALARVKDHLIYRYPLPGQAENRWKWETFEKNLFGEPSNVLPNWSPVISLTVDHPSSIGTGTQNFTVTVSDNSYAPIEDALVCVWKGSEVYDYGLTDASGQIIFAINPQTPGSMDVTVSERNHLTYEGVVTVTGPGITEPEVESSQPVCFGLGQNRPNPFGKATTIRFQLAQPAKVRLAIFDATGRRVRTLVSGDKDAGYYQAVWNGTNDAGVPCGNGIYFYRIEAGDFVATKNLVIMR